MAGREVRGEPFNGLCERVKFRDIASGPGPELNFIAVSTLVPHWSPEPNGFARALSSYLYLPDSAKAAMATHAIDRMLDLLELLLIEGKFYTIFSVPFGVGFSILLSRASAKGLVFHRLFLRRVFFLFVFGAAHAVLLWHNDILAAYALCGALLLPFATARNRTTLAFATLALLAPLAIKLAGGIPSGFLTGRAERAR
jgi:uncharacterized membrane protein YeiB